MTADERPIEREGVAHKLYASPEAAALIDYMTDPVEGLGLWKKRIEAGMFLAAYAAFKELAPAPLGKREIVGDFVAVQTSITNIGELGAFHIVYGAGKSVDQTLRDVLPGLVDAGAARLGPLLKGPDPVGALISELRDVRLA